MMKSLMKRIEQLRRSLSKNLIRPPCRIAEEDGSGDLLSSSGEGENPDALVACGCSWLLVSWRPLVFIGKTRLGLKRPVTDWVSPLNTIRHRLIAKINSKRKLRTCEALSQILADH
jgi:hypothetical protein